MSVYTHLERQLTRTDPELYGLPHPKIAKVVGSMIHLNQVLGDKGLEALNRAMGRRNYPKGELIRRAAIACPDIVKLKELSEYDGKINIMELEGYLAPLRFYANQGRIFEIEKELDELLALTDIGSSTPIEFFRLPFPAVYFHFGAHGGGLEIHANKVGTSKLLGAYVTDLYLQNPTRIRETEPFLRWAGEDGGLTCYEIALVGYPVSTIFDHGFSLLRLYVGAKMAEMSVADVLVLNFEGHKSTRTAAVSPVQREQLEAGIAHLTKTLLFLNSESVRQRESLEESELSTRIQGLGSKKQEEQKRRLARTYDRITVNFQRDSTEPTPSTTGTAEAKPASRQRGHFWAQHLGPRNSQSQLLWIKPELVRGDRRGEEPIKDYVVGVRTPDE